MMYLITILWLISGPPPSQNGSFCRNYWDEEGWTYTRFFLGVGGGGVVLFFCCFNKNPKLFLFSFACDQNTFLKQPHFFTNSVLYVLMFFKGGAIKNSSQIGSLILWLILQVIIAQKEIRERSMNCSIRRQMVWSIDMSRCFDRLDPSWKWRARQLTFPDQSLTLLSLWLEGLRHLHSLCKTLGRWIRSSWAV